MTDMTHSTPKLWQRTIAFVLDIFLALNLALVVLIVYVLPQKFPGQFTEFAKSLQAYMHAVQAAQAAGVQPEPLSLSESQVSLLYYSQNITMLVVWLYFMLGEAFLKGSSLGKRVFMLKVISRRNGEVSFIESALRSAIKTISLLIAFPVFMVNYLTVFFNKRQITVHDWLATTCVVEDVLPEDASDPDQDDEEAA